MNPIDCPACARFSLGAGSGGFDLLEQVVKLGTGAVVAEHHSQSVIKEGTVEFAFQETEVAFANSRDQMGPVQHPGQYGDAF